MVEKWYFLSSVRGEHPGVGFAPGPGELGSALLSLSLYKEISGLMNDNNATILRLWQRTVSVPSSRDSSLFDRPGSKGAPGMKFQKQIDGFLRIRLRGCKHCSCTHARARTTLYVPIRDDNQAIYSLTQHLKNQTTIPDSLQ